MTPADKYTYRVRWSVADNDYLVTIAEFPSLSWLASSPYDALAGAITLVADVIDDMASSGESIPEPMSEHDYSGKFMVRIPPEAHRELAVAAAEQNISLNRLASKRLVVT